MRMQANEQYPADRVHGVKHDEDENCCEGAYPCVPVSDSQLDALENRMAKVEGLLTSHVSADYTHGDAPKPVEPKEEPKLPPEVGDEVRGMSYANHQPVSGIMLLQPQKGLTAVQTAKGIRLGITQVCFLFRPPLVAGEQVRRRSDGRPGIVSLEADGMAVCLPRCEPYWPGNWWEKATNADFARVCWNPKLHEGKKP